MVAIVTVDELADALRIDEGTPSYERAERLVPWCAAEIDRMAPAAPDAVRHRAIALWTAFLLVAPMGRTANAYILSGAGALVRPWATLPVVLIA